MNNFSEQIFILIVSIFIFCGAVFAVNPVTISKTSASLLDDIAKGAVKNYTVRHTGLLLKMGTRIDDFVPLIKKYPLQEQRNILLEVLKSKDLVKSTETLVLKGRLKKGEIAEADLIRAIKSNKKVDEIIIGNKKNVKASTSTNGKSTEKDLIGKKEFEENFQITAEKEGKYIHDEKAVRGGGLKGTRRPDKISVDEKNETLTKIETKSPKEARNPLSWCGTYKNDYLKTCREKVKSYYGGCNRKSAWMIVIACQANCYRQSGFKNSNLKEKYKSYKKQTGLLVPKDQVDDILAVLGKQAKTVSYGDSVLFELSEETMEKLTSQFGVAKDLAGQCTPK